MKKHLKSMKMYAKVCHVRIPVVLACVLNELREDRWGEREAESSSTKVRLLSSPPTGLLYHPAPHPFKGSNRASRQTFVNFLGRFVNTL